MAAAGKRPAGEEEAAGRCYGQLLLTLRGGPAGGGEGEGVCGLWWEGVRGRWRAPGETPWGGGYVGDSSKARRGVVPATRGRIGCGSAVLTFMRDVCAGWGAAVAGCGGSAPWLATRPASRGQQATASGPSEFRRETAL